MCAGKRPAAQSMDAFLVAAPAPSQPKKKKAKMT